MTLKFRTVTPTSFDALTTEQQQEQEQQQQQQERTKKDKICFSLSTAQDSKYLSEMHCLIRSLCCEWFIVTEDDIHSSRSALSIQAGRRFPVTVGRVGIRCKFCKDCPAHEKTIQSTAFPSQLSVIYSAVVMMQCRHFPHCHKIPLELRNKLSSMKRGSGYSVGPPITDDSNILSAPGRMQYWIDSAITLGLVDSPDGIRFDANYNKNKQKYNNTTNIQDTCVISISTTSTTPCKDILSSPSNQNNSNSNNIHTKLTNSQELVSFNSYNSVEDYNQSLTTPQMKPKTSNRQAIVTPNDKNESSYANKDYILSLLGESNHNIISIEDKDLVPDYLFLAMAQMKPCTLTEADKVGCYKDRQVGFVGMCCKHCGGQPGFGKFFPATVRSLAQTTTSQTIVKHISSKCRICPVHIREAVLKLQQQDQGVKDKVETSTTKQENEQQDPQQQQQQGFEAKPRYGSRKIFFQRIWTRLHGPKTNTHSNTNNSSNTFMRTLQDSPNDNNTKKSSTTTTQINHHQSPQGFVSPSDSMMGSTYNNNDGHDDSSSPSSDVDERVCHFHNHHRHHHPKRPILPTNRNRVVSYDGDNTQSSRLGSSQNKRMRLISY
jgi:hypothetical protein